MRALANAYGFEVKPWRIVLVVGTIMFPPLLAAYIVAWIAIPEEPAPPRAPAEMVRSGSGAWAALAALGLLAWLAVEDGPGGGGIAVAAILVAAGFLLWRSVNDGGPASADGSAARPAAEPDGMPGDPAGASAASQPWGAPAGWSGPERWGPGSTDLVPSPGGLAVDAGASPTPGSAAPWASPPWSDTPVAAPRPARPPITGVTLALVPVVLGGALAGDAFGWWSMSVANALALVLVVVGAGLLVGALLGAGRGLAPVALALVPAVILASTFPDVSLRGAWGDRLVSPATAAEASGGFDHGVGKLTVDLQELPAGAVATVPVELGVGHLEVLVPDDLDLVVEAKVGAGQLDLDERRTDGVRLEEVWTTSGGPEATGALRLELEVGVGHIDIETRPRLQEAPR